MKSIVDPREKIEDAPHGRERGHDAWKRAKVERGLAEAEAEDRASMIPADRILRDFGLGSWLHAAGAAGLGVDPRLDRRGR